MLMQPNSNPNPNPDPYTTLNQKPNDNPCFYFLSREISSQEQISDHLGQGYGSYKM